MKTLLLFVFAFISINSNSQNWCPPGAEWTYNYTDMFASGYIRATLKGDTTVNGQSCKKIIVRNKIRVGTYFPSFDTSYIDPVYTFSKNDTVFIYRHALDSFVAVYIFNSQVGDTLEYLNFLNSPTPQPVSLIVDSTGTETINNKPLKFYIVHVLDSTFIYPTFPFKITESIGSWLYMQPEFQSFTDGGGYSLRCYKDDSLGTFKVSTSIACDYFYTSIDEIGNKHFTVYPNPTSSTITLKNNVALNYTITNSLGQTLLKGVTQPQQNINLDILDDGIYFISLSTNTNRQTINFIKVE